MGERLHPNNCLWVLCCCGCLPILGLLKGIITVVPSILLQWIPCTIISIILLPHDIFITYYSFLASKKIGPNLTAMAMMLLPIPLILWPPSVCIATFIFGAGFGLFNPIGKTFDDRYEVFCGGIIETLKEGAEFVKKFWEFNSDSYFTYLFDFRNYNLKDGEKPFDISVIQLFIGTLIGTSGSIIDGICFTVLAVIYLIPGIFRGYFELWKWYCKYCSKGCDSCVEFVWFGLMFPIFILANAVLAPGIVLVAAFAALSGFFIGLSAGYHAYNSGVPEAYKKVFEWVSEFNKGANKAIFGNN